MLVAGTILVSVVFAGSARSIETQREHFQDRDIVIVGAGMAGLSAALEAARDGAKVTVLDMASVFGGHAVMSGGDVTIVDTPLQRAKGVHDSPELAYKDFTEWGKDANADWVHYYVTHSRSEIYDWLVAMGVMFEELDRFPGNSVPRQHVTHGRGLGLVSPLYRECLNNPNIEFVWNTQVLDLIVDRQRITGLRGENLRTGQAREFHARAVILATGGFQSNLALVLRNWPRDLPVPDHLLAGSGVNSVGSGLELATKAGAALFNLDHQWNYERGLPDPRYPGMHRGLSVSVDEAVEVNALGRPFVATGDSSDARLKAVLSQPGTTYWAIFDEKTKRNFSISSPDWGNFATIQRFILDNPEVVKKAATLDDLAIKAGLPARALKETIAQHNAGPSKIDTPPYYAAQFFPLTRKSMGGIAIDLSARVLDKQGDPIPGLYAAGEAAGEAGINGKAALEGTFLGPSVVIGRVAARSATADLGISARAASISTAPVEHPMASAESVGSDACKGCHDLKALVSKPRAGYWHFERAHRIVLERQYVCVQCHGEIALPFKQENHRIDKLAQVNICSHCHVGQ